MSENRRILPTESNGKNGTYTLGNVWTPQGVLSHVASYGQRYDARLCDEVWVFAQNDLEAAVKKAREHQ